MIKDSIASAWTQTG